MIVSVTIANNREAEIADAVRSVVDHVDRVLLIDTGITDQTAVIAKEIAGGKFVKFSTRWVDYSTARNTGLEVARGLGATWAIIVDSDERINVGSFNLRAALSIPDMDILMIESVDGHYPKEKIIRAKSDVRYVGPTHETVIGDKARATLLGVTFSELPKSPEQLALKFSRDVRLLTDYVSKNPDDPRWWYYLGASYEGVGDRTLAAGAFGQCVERRKTGNEAAWAAYKQAEQLFMLDRFDEAIAAAARGLAANATFAECAWIAAVSASRVNRNDQAIAWARIAESVGLYKGCGTHRAWFRHMPALYELPYDVLRFSLQDEASKKRAEDDFHAAKRARVGASDAADLDRLSILRGVPEPNRNEARSMLRPGKLADLCPSTRSTKIQFDPPGGLRPMNPSICRHNGDLWCVVRSINYSLHGRDYTIDDPDGIVRTENYLGLLGPNGELENPKHMRDLDTSPRQPSQVVGYEDVRLVSIKDPHGGFVLTASATVCDRDTDRRLIAWLHLDKDGNVERSDVQRSNQWHEKNWMPLSVRGKLAWIYSLDPTCVLPADHSDPSPLWDCPFALEHLRGGAVIAFDDGYLCVMHEAIDTDEGRIYLHRFVKLSEDFHVKSVSPTWVFAHHGIEFCAGLVLDGDDFVISYGIDDREAWITRVAVEDVEAMRWITP